MKSIVILDKNGGIAASLNRILDNNLFKICHVKRQEGIDCLLKDENVHIVLILYVFEKEDQLSSFLKNYDYPFAFALIPTNSIIYYKIKKIKDVSLFDIQKPSKEFNEELIDFIMAIGYSDTKYPKLIDKSLRQLHKKLFFS